MPRNDATRLTVVALIALLCFSCTVANPAPPEWRRSIKKAQVSPYGAWIIVDLVTDHRLEGELIAVEDDKLWIGSEGELVPISRNQIRKTTVAAYTAESGGLIGAATLGTLSTLSHGFFLVITAPLWMLLGGGIARAHSSAGYIELSGARGVPIANLRKWARFPQGLPEQLRHPKRHQPAHPGSTPKPPEERGKLGGACFPNQTCHQGLECDPESQRCRQPPKLGTAGGRCFANQTCRDQLVCQQAICVAPPPPPAEGQPPAEQSPPTEGQPPPDPAGNGATP